MQFLLALIFTIIVSTTAFAPKGFRAPSSVKMTMKIDSNKLKTMIPAAVLPFVAPMAVFAAEGTGRAFGIDDGRLIFAALFPSLIIFPLYLQWSSQQEKDDFFDGYEKRRNG